MRPKVRFFLRPPRPPKPNRLRICSSGQRRRRTHRPLSSVVEHSVYIRLVGGSNPSAATRFMTEQNGSQRCIPMSPETAIDRFTGPDAVRDFIRRNPQVDPEVICNTTEEFQREITTGGIRLLECVALLIDRQMSQEKALLRKAAQQSSVVLETLAEAPRIPIRKQRLPRLTNLFTAFK